MESGQDIHAESGQMTDGNYDLGEIEAARAGWEG